VMHELFIIVKLGPLISDASWGGGGLLLG
jgi:hypothetical protein